MKLRISVSSITLLFVLFFGSCQKEITNNILNPSNPLGTDSNYIDKWYVLDSDDTTSVYTFSYNDKKRATKVDLTENDGYELKHYSTTEYFYTNNDTLPYKSYSLINDFFSIPTNYDTTIHFYFYDAMARIIKDSVITNTGSFTTQPNSSEYYKNILVNNYIYSPGKKIGDSFFYEIVDGVYSLSYEVNDTTLLDNNENELNNLFYISYSNGLQFYKIKTDLTYNNSPNVFIKLNIRNNFDYPGVFEHLDKFPMNTKNNPVQFHQVEGYILDSQIFIDDWIYTYTYQANGLVREVLIPNQGAPGLIYETKYLFTYKAL